MPRKTITLEIDDEAQEQLLRNSHALVRERNELARTAPDAVVVDQLEELAHQRSRAGVLGSSCLA